MKMLYKISGDFQIFIMVLDLVQRIPIAEDLLLVMRKGFSLITDKRFHSLYRCDNPFNRIAALHRIDHGRVPQFPEYLRIICFSDFTFPAQVIDNPGYFQQISRKTVRKELIPLGSLPCRIAAGRRGIVLQVPKGRFR